MSNAAKTFGTADFKKALTGAPNGKIFVDGKAHDLGHANEKVETLRSIAKKLNDTDWDYFVKNGKISENTVVKLSSTEMNFLSGGKANPTLEIESGGWGFRLNMGPGGSSDSWISIAGTKYYSVW